MGYDYSHILMQKKIVLEIGKKKYPAILYVLT